MWQRLESDPGLFYELAERLGTKGVEFFELFDVEPDSFAAFTKLHGVLFLFKHRQQAAAAPPAAGSYAPDAPVFFAQQIAQDACATQAILGVLLNANGVELGPELAEFREFTGELDPETRGEAIAGSDFLRTAHNHMARPNAFYDDEEVPAPADEDADGLFHYISYVPVDGRLYEIDGLRPAVIDHGRFEEGPLGLSQALSRTLQARIQQHAEGELRFSVIAMIADENLQDKAAAYRENALRRQQFTGLALEVIKQLARHATPAEWDAVVERGRARPAPAGQATAPATGSGPGAGS